MYSLLHKLGLYQFVKREGIPFSIALIITELLYKFGSFILEVSAFLITWYIAGALVSFFRSGKKDDFFN